MADTFIALVLDDSGNVISSSAHINLESAEEYGTTVNARKPSSAGFYTVEIYKNDSSCKVEEFVLI